MHSEEGEEVLDEILEEEEDLEGVISDVEDGDKDIDSILEPLLDIRRRCHEQAKENISAAQRKQKRQ